MTVADDRATLEQNLSTLHGIREELFAYGRRPEHSDPTYTLARMLDRLRSALSVHDAAAIKAQARWEAIEECARYCDGRTDEMDEVEAREVWTVAANSLRRLAADPAARGREEQRPGPQVVRTPDDDGALASTGGAGSSPAWGANQPESVPSDATMPPLAGQPGARAPVSTPPAPDAERLALVERAYAFLRSSKWTPGYDQRRTVELYADFAESENAELARVKAENERLRKALSIAERTLMNAAATFTLEEIEAALAPPAKEPK